MSSYALLLAIAATASAATPIEEIAARRRDIRPAASRAMIDDLRAAHPEHLPKAEDFLSRLAALEPRLAEADALLVDTASPDARTRAAGILDEAHALQREIARAHPLASAHPILFVVREQYLEDHHNTETLFHTGEPNCVKYRPGGALKALDLATGRVTTLVDPGPEGLARDPEVHFDGRRVLFSMRRAKDENYSIYEVDINRSEDGSVAQGALRRLTNEPMATDIDPVYLPDGRIVFSSTREPKYCHCNMHIMANLYRMDGDGANIHQISKNTLFDGHASVVRLTLLYIWRFWP